MKIAQLMTESNVKFGTSGARGLARDITDLVAYSYTQAFLGQMRDTAQLDCEKPLVALGGDLRPSTERIIRAASQAVLDFGFTPLNCGRLPSPALALFAMKEGICSVMVTGSHIPGDRNGIKYNKPTGEITKEDERGIREQQPEIPAKRFSEKGLLITPSPSPSPSPSRGFPLNTQANKLYLQRYLNAFPRGILSGKRIGLYEHSAVGRDLLAEIYSGLGAELVRFGRSESFIPVDTEAIREEDCQLALEWAAKENLHALVSTDGDSDRPLIADEQGRWIRGDISGILTADFLNADGVATPVSCNTALERARRFKRILRTKIGSPYVIRGMDKLREEGLAVIVGYEANGGFLLASEVQIKGGGRLSALPTRDAVIVHLALLCLAVSRGKPLSALALELPQRFTASDRIKEFESEKSKAILEQLACGRDKQHFPQIASVFGPHFGELCAADTTDGLRMSFSGERIVHLRASGNAPEFRCYTEASSHEQAGELLNTALEIMTQWRSKDLPLLP